MKVYKFIKSKIERDYFFVTGNLKVDSKYFIKKIEEGIHQNNNMNFETNVKGSMTSYNFFEKDKKFYHDIILPIFDMLDEQNFEDKYYLKSGWGFKHNFGDYTKKHTHIPNFLSAAIMLTAHSQFLSFPEINENVESKLGNFVIFSSFLSHGNKRNNLEKPRYGLSLNISYDTD